MLFARAIASIHGGRPVALLPLVLAAGAATGPARVDFKRDVQPILAQRCQGCHGPVRRESGLRLDRKRDALEGGDSGRALIQPGGGELLRRLTAPDPRTRMPPGAPLSTRELPILQNWIAAGAPWPDDPQDETDPADHWAFRPVRRPPLPAVRNIAWARSPIDYFVLAALERRGLRPSPEADRPTLIRRLSLDLVGLPPSPAEVDAFVADTAPDAYGRLVDRLLASPHYGERWGRHWLDLARYADSNGYTIDSARHIWKYRDWVIEALNRDLPFDRFTIEQLAGDLLPGEDVGRLVATGFHRNTLINEEGGTDQEQFRVEAVVDRVNTTGATWLGLTIGCAQCHSHKYDPISQREYYRLFAFFNDQDEPVLSLGTPEQADERRRLAAEEESLAAALRAMAPLDPMRRATETRQADVQKRLKDLDARIPTTLILRERRSPRETRVHLRGDFLRPGARVEPGTPAVLPPLRPAGTKPNRLDLAQWLVDRENPLTARVTVNRIWGHYFGRGLVETENDFGSQGSPPTHPELLDWLAYTFAAPVDPARVDAGCGWSLKRLHRLIVTSATYRQSSAVRPDLAAADPRNLLLGRQTRLRLEAEIVRDNALAASGLLNGRIGGPSVFPTQPGNLDLFTQNKKNWIPSLGEDRYRRSLYTFHWRSSPHPLLTALDAPDGNLTCTRRARSNTPLGALMLANDEVFIDSARALAAATSSGAPHGDRFRLIDMFRRCLARQPSPAELTLLHAALIRQRIAFAREPPAAARAAGLPPGAGGAVDAAAWTALARVLLNLDEFITRE